MATQPKSLSYEQREALYRQLEPRKLNPLQRDALAVQDHDSKIYYPKFSLEITVAPNYEERRMSFFYLILHEPAERDWNRFQMEDAFRDATWRLLHRRKLDQGFVDHASLYQLIDALQKESNGLTDTEYIFTRLNKVIHGQPKDREIDLYSVL